MRLYFFRTSSHIPIEEMKRVADKVSKVFNIDYSIFTGAILCSTEHISIEDILSISDKFLERGEPVVAIAFTQEGIRDDETILGQGSQLSRGAWVKWTDNIDRITIATLHELAHICEAEHCANESCVMFPVYREHKGNSIKELFCNKCMNTIENSWIFNRLRQSTDDRIKKNRKLPEIVHSTQAQISFDAHTQLKYTSLSRRISVTQESFSPFPFPDWSLANRNKEEFIRRVIMHFGYKRDE